MHDTELLERAIMSLLETGGMVRTTTADNRPLPLAAYRETPPHPTETVTITAYETPTRLDSRVYDKLGHVQVRIRTKSVPAARKAIMLARELLEVTRITAGPLYVHESYEQSYMWLGRTETGAYESTQNFAIRY